MDSWVFFGIFIVGIFIFSFIGVVYLLAKTQRQEEIIKKIEAKINSLQFGMAYSQTVPQSPKEETVTPVDVMPLAEPVAPVEAVTPVDVMPPAEPVAPVEEVTPIAAKPPAEPVAPVEAVTPVAAKPPAENRLYTVIASFIRGGNLWAAGGVILLMVGFGTLIAYLARRGFFTVEMGIAAAAATGIAMIIFGWRFKEKRPVYFKILQGGGLGILYLAIYAAYKFTPHFSLPLSLILMTLLVPPTIILALFQNSQGLALLGFAGGFVTPLLFSTGNGNHLFLFAYYLILNSGVLAIGFFRRWKGLDLLAFFFTFAISLYWTMNRYRSEFFITSEPFFILYIILFTFIGLFSFGSRKDGLKNSQTAKLNELSNIILILGTPAAAAAIQWKVFSFLSHGYSIIAIAFSAFYLLLSIFILKHFPTSKVRMGNVQGNTTSRIYAEVYLTFGVLLANLIIPLELSNQITGAIWAAEGAVVFFLGLRMAGKTWKGITKDSGRGDPRVILAGLIIHVASTVVFIRDIYLVNYKSLDWRSPGFIGSIVISVSALAMAVLAGKFFSLKDQTEKSAQKLNPVSWILSLWGFFWWFGGWSFEFTRILTNPLDAFFILASATAVLSWTFLAFLKLKIFLIGMVPAPIAAAIAVLIIFTNNINEGASWEYIFTYNFFDPAQIKGTMSFLLSQGLTLFILKPGTNLTEKKIKSFEPVIFRSIRLFLILLTVLAGISSSLRFYTLKYELSVSWTSLAGLLPVFILLFSISLLRKGGKEKLWEKLLHPILPFVLSIVLLIWFIISLYYPGDPSPLPFYIPLLNPLDLLEGFCIVSILFWQINKDNDRKFILGKKVFIATVDVMVFFWALLIIARSLHFYAGKNWYYVSRSDEFQLCMFLFWALYGIFHIIIGHKKKSRIVWIIGAALVTVDIAKLIFLDLKDIGTIPRILSFFAAGFVLLFIGWAAPIPPSAHRKEKKLKENN